MKLKELSVDENPSFPETSKSIEKSHEELIVKLAEEQRNNDEIKKQ